MKESIEYTRADFAHFALERIWEVYYVQYHAYDCAG